MTPLISIVLPAYKAAFLFQSISSVLNQTFEDLELIIVNDKSPDDITTIVESFNDDRIKYYINDKNIGGKDPVANWNKCLSYAKGEFFSLICDDDVYESTFIEELLLLADKYPACNVFRARAIIVDYNNNIVDYYPSAPEWESSLDYMWHRVSGFRRQTISEFLYRREHILKLEGYSSFPLAWCADDVSIYRFSKEGGIATCNEFLVKFRMSGINITSSNDKNIISKIEAENQYSKWIINYISDEDESFIRIILTTRALKEKEIKISLLTCAKWGDFLFLYRYRNTDKYFISVPCIVKALLKRIAGIGRN